MGISKRTLAQDVIALAQLAMEDPAKNAYLAHYLCITFNLKTNVFLRLVACRANSLRMYLQHVLPVIIHVSLAQGLFLQTAQPVEIP